MKLHFGRNIYGLAAIAFGIITLVWHKVDSLGSISSSVILVYIIGLTEIAGGIAIQWQRTVKPGALALSTVYFIFSLYLLFQIIEMPLEYFNWGNFFEQLSIVLGGIIVFASTIQSGIKRAYIEKAVYRCFGICVISYSLYQLFYLPYTASLVPKWIPPSQMFWAVATTIAFAAAAYAVITGRLALLASRLLTIMFISFGLLIWLPDSFITPYKFSYWVSNAQNLAVAGSVWIIADFLSQQNISTLRWPFGRMHIEHSEGFEQ